MKRSLTLIFLFTLVPASLLAQWSMNFSCGWLDNACPAWKVYDNRTKPFSIWSNGWQADSGVEYRKKAWLSVGGSGYYQSFKAKPSGAYDAWAQSYDWIGEFSWQAPVELYVRLIRSKSLLGVNLKLGLGMMASHIGKLTITSAAGDYVTPTPVTEVYSGTGKTVLRPFGRASAGIRVPVTARAGLTMDFGYLATFDRMIQELPLNLGWDIKW